jgi:hypothetical protein
MVRTMGFGLRAFLALALVLAPGGAGALVLVGCTPPTFIVQQYSGSPRERETIAILRVNGSDSVRLLTLDDEDVAAPVQDDTRLHIELLPARHKVTVVNVKAPSERYEPILFQAEANHVYRVIVEGTTARIFDVDRASDRVLTDATMVIPPGTSDLREVDPKDRKQEAPRSKRRPASPSVEEIDPKDPKDAGTSPPTADPLPSEAGAP